MAGKGFLPSPRLVPFAFRGILELSVSVMCQGRASSDFQAVSHCPEQRGDGHRAWAAGGWVGARLRCWWLKPGQS